ncbi:MAG: hypothetical protein VB074_12250 [Proteiniphilum sp.]|uniref:hypothetical protein n=1 Tax=Proteiniphilum sp. TaxID=1926877 RepID=UPI0009262407|nr:hypothetical protein [Proteiniphilum sp.]MEA5062134.1 hypothetical protein [Petrimonas sp.]MEA5128949.1 hypothetical protein [Proteiniphilum sp.]OJV80536.1 MAG: hypothetical protein BGO34_15690 [Bacteroidia bacterium 44-10]
MQFSYNLARNIQESDRNTYDLSTFIDGETDDIHPGHLPAGYETGYIDSLSNRSDSRTLAHELALRMHYSDDIIYWDRQTGEGRDIHHHPYFRVHCLPPAPQKEKTG